jgi:hypothetical protein
MHGVCALTSLIEGKAIFVFLSGTQGPFLRTKMAAAMI